MSAVPVKTMIDAAAHYWAPKEDYSSSSAASNWSALVTKGGFTAWSRTGGNAERESQYHTNADKTGVKSTLKLEVPSVGIVAAQKRHVPIELFPPAWGSAPYLGHNPGDHVFKLVITAQNGEIEACLKYEGQIPQPRERYQHRFETILPDIIDMVVCVLSFVPKVKSHCLQPLVPCYLQVIKHKRGRINQNDLDLLIRFWDEKFTDWDHEGNGIKIRSSEVIPQPILRSSLHLIGEAAFLLNKLQLSRNPSSWEPDFDFTSLILLLEKLADKPLTKLLRHHFDKMNHEGLEIIHGLAGSPDQVLVYCDKEDIPDTEVSVDNSQEETTKNRRRLNKDAAEINGWRRGAENPAASPDRPGYHTPGATAEAAKDQLVHRFGWFADPLKSSTFHQFYQQQPQQQPRHHRDLVFRAGSGSSNNSIARALPTTPDRLVSELSTSRLTPPLDDHIRDTIVVCNSQLCSCKISGPFPSADSAVVDDKQTPSSYRLRRPETGDKGVAVPKGRGRVEKRRRKTSSTTSRLRITKQDVRRFFKI